MSDLAAAASRENKLITTPSQLRHDDFSRADPFVQAALTENKRSGMVLAVRTRWIAMAIVGVMVPFINPTWEALYYEVALLIYAFIGWLQLKSAKVSQSRRELFLIYVDLAFLTFLLVMPNPLRTEEWPTAYQYELSEFAYFFILLAGATLAYSWRTLVGFAIWTSVFWMIGVGYVAYFGTEIPILSEKAAEAFAGYDRILETIDPNDLNFAARIQEIVIFAIVAYILAINGRRNTELLFRQAGVARERANLARHFPPTLVDEMAERDEPLGAVRSQDVAVMFVDIVGFTRMAERQSPEETVALLREYHERLEAKVFEHNGTLDKFLGDGLMATFGTPTPGPDDAENALLCGEAILADIEAWNAIRARKDEPPITVSVGLHFGNVVLGDIGSARRLEYAVLGDAVNVASRLEAMTRNLKVGMVVSGALVDAAGKNANPEITRLLQGLEDAGAHQLRGRDAPTRIWTR